MKQFGNRGYISDYTFLFLNHRESVTKDFHKKKISEPFFFQF